MPSEPGFIDERGVYCGMGDLQCLFTFAAFDGFADKIY